MFRQTLLLILVVAGGTFAADPPLPDGTAAATKAIAGFKHPSGMRVTLFAAEPMLASPVAFCLDEKNRVFVAEEFRFNRGTEENRTRPFMLDDDLQIATVADRLKMYQKWASRFDGGMDWFRKQSDQVRLLEDRNGDGRADFSSVFAEGFNDPLDGLASGILARDGNIYFTCIPNLWLLKDTKGIGKADVRQALHHGFGVNCAFLGHDLHGLTWGPDGKLYFSVGDRGFHVVTKEGKTLSGPRTGAVFRCNADGSDLEVIHRGLRNPQELAFDQFGNLFAVDNNCDKGDHSRLVHIVEDGDSGWNMAYQTIPEPYLTGPWHAERMWHLPHKGQPAWIIPPVGKIGAGPSGFVFTSGVSLPERYRNKFFYCNYTGNGGVESFGVVPHGAGFAMTDYHDFLKPIMATDVDFGYDGKMYVSDFVNLDWTGKSLGGRIYTLFDPERLKEPVVRETRQLFAEGFAHRHEAELGRLLGHADLRVRQRAQFALAERGDKGLRVFHRTVTLSTNLLARLHAMWGIGQVARTRLDVARSLLVLLKDPDAEVRAQAAKLLGDVRFPGAGRELTEFLGDSSPRVRYYACMSLGKVSHRPAIEPIFALLKANADQDVFLRHAGVTALARMNDANAVLARVRDESPAVRRAALLVLRRLHDRRIAQFLDDAELDIVTEAARAINDLPIVDAFPSLAAMMDRHGANPTPEAEPLLRRAINAHFRLGQPRNFEALARFAGNLRVSTRMRSEAIQALADWAVPSPRDRVIGFWRALPQRDLGPVRPILETALPAILLQTTGPLQAEAIKLIGKFDIKTDDAAFAKWVGDRSRDPSARIAALQLLADRKHKDIDALISTALKDDESRVRAEARALLARLKPEHAVALVEAVLADSKAAPLERQSALVLLPTLAGAGKLLDDWNARLIRNDVPANLLLDVVEALKASPRHKPDADRWEKALPATDALAKYRLALEGGDAERGRSVFVGHAAAQCIRCHKAGPDGGDAGPDLNKLRERNPKLTREHLLESLILPSKQITPGFASVVVTLTDGKNVAGTIKAEDDASITLTLPTGAVRRIAKKEIEERSTPTSAMPEMARALSLREMRDVIEYLMALR